MSFKERAYAFLDKHGDKLVAGALLGVSALGMYNVAGLRKARIQAQQAANDLSKLALDLKAITSKGKTVVFTGCQLNEEVHDKRYRGPYAS